jgi:hypothetical protein
MQSMRTVTGHRLYQTKLFSLRQARSDLQKLCASPMWQITTVSDLTESGREEKSLWTFQMHSHPGYTAGSRRAYCKMDAMTSFWKRACVALSDDSFRFLTPVFAAVDRPNPMYLGVVDIHSGMAELRNPLLHKSPSSPSAGRPTLRLPITDSSTYRAHHDLAA